MILEKLQIFGYSEAAENAILASLLLGESTLLIGPPGSAKTGMVEALGAALRESTKRKHKKNPAKWFSYQIYDASKLNFEEMFGYPNINDMKKDPPEINFIRTPCTIWDKHLVGLDELNRCAEDRQSNLLEIIRSRRLQGINTNNLAIFCTMNPFGGVGTIAMDDALVDRQLFYIRVDDFHKMNHKEKKKVITRTGASDSVGLRFWGDYKGDLDTSETKVNDYLADIGDMIHEMMTDASTHLSNLRETLSFQVSELISRLVDIFAKEFDKEKDSVKKETNISGRRAGTLLRGVMGIRAIQLAKTKYGQELDSLLPTIINTVKLAIPIGIAGNLDQTLISRVESLVDTTIKSLWASIAKNKNSDDIDLLATALNTKNPIKILNILLSQSLTKVTRDKIFSQLLNEEHYSVSGRVNTSLFNANKVLLYYLNEKIPDFVPKNINLGMTPEILKSVGQLMDVPCTPIFDKHKDMLEAIVADVEKLNDKELANLIITGLKLAVPYYAERCTTDNEVISAIVDLKDIISVLKTSIKTHADSKNPEV